MDGIHRRDVEQILAHARSLPTTNGAADQTGLPALETVTFGAVFGRLTRVRNLDVKGLASATASSSATVKGTTGDHLVPSAGHLRVIASALCFRSDDLEAMTGRPGEKPQADSIVARSYPSVWVVGELIWALTPLQAEQIDAVIAFTQGLQHTHTDQPDGT